MKLHTFAFGVGTLLMIPFGMVAGAQSFDPNLDGMSRDELLAQRQAMRANTYDAKVSADANADKTVQQRARVNVYRPTSRRSISALTKREDTAKLNFGVARTFASTRNMSNLGLTISPYTLRGQIQENVKSDIEERSADKPRAINKTLNRAKNSGVSMAQLGDRNLDQRLQSTEGQRRFKQVAESSDIDNRPWRSASSIVSAKQAEKQREIQQKRMETIKKRLNRSSRTTFRNSTRDASLDNELDVE